jgi:Flp pilus assembly protein TadG
MRNRLRHLHRNERGMTYVFVGVGFFAFMAASTLAVDVGMFMTARSQAQNAADAGALSGATALAFNSSTNKTPTGPAVLSAISAAQANHMMGESPSVLPADVTFPVGPNGENRIRVEVFRTTARQNPIPTLIGPLFGVPTASIHANATAEVSPANAMRCVKPFMIPDKWTENGGNDIYNLGNDVYIPAGTTGYTGYTTARDAGTPLVLRAGVGNNIEQSFYYSWKMSDAIGGDFYRENIANCNWEVYVYDPDNPVYLIQEPGAQAGPTLQGIRELHVRERQRLHRAESPCVSDPAVQPTVLRRGESERPERRLQARELPRVLRRLRGGQRQNPRHHYENRRDGRPERRAGHDRQLRGGHPIGSIALSARRPR